MTAPRRPALRYFGGKWLLAPKIIPLIPPHRIYVEPFGGAGSVLLRKPRSHTEVWNDLDDELVNLFRMLRGQGTAAELHRRLRLTPFARAEFNEAYEPQPDDVGRAWALVIRSFMGFGADGASSPYRTGFRASSRDSGRCPAGDWANYTDLVDILVDRVRGIVVENRDGLEVMASFDGAQTVHYVDPPYHPETRSRDGRQRGGGVYRHELDAKGHEALLQSLQGLQGMVLLSGYRCELYDDVLAGWTRYDFGTYADGGRPRTDSLWLNMAAVDGSKTSLLDFATR